MEQLLFGFTLPPKGGYLRVASKIPLSGGFL